MRHMETEGRRCSESHTHICNVPAAERSKRIFFLVWSCKRTFIANEITSVARKKPDRNIETQDFLSNLMGNTIKK